jgi:hypothetical protein
MTLLHTGLPAVATTATATATTAATTAAAAGSRVQPSSLQRSLPYRATTMFEFLLALLTLSGLLPIAKVLALGADQGKNDPCPSSLPPLAFLLGDSC